MILNLTPHTVTIFKPETPDRIGVTFGLKSYIVATIKSSEPLRLTELVASAAYIDGILVNWVRYGNLSYNPPQEQDTYYIVSLATALAVRREDFLVPHREVRNMDGVIIGCRALAKPS